MKTVSVVMCTFNGELFLREQIDSLIRQTYPIHEIIIQDDGSTDCTLQIASAYQQRYPDYNIKIYSNPRQLGFNRNFFSAILKATGDFIACCDQDDIWEASKLEVLISEIGENSLIYHNSILFNQMGELGKLHKKPLPRLTSSLSAILMPQSFGHQILFKKEIITALRPFTDFNLSYDYFIYTISTSIGPVKYTDTPLVRWRRHNHAATFSEKKKSASKWKGYWTALEALSNTANRNTTSRYFQLCRQIHFQEKDTNTVIQNMSTGKLADILKTCYLCLKYRKELVTDKKGIIAYLRAFFIPLFFIRDYGSYIIRD